MNLVLTRHKYAPEVTLGKLFVDGLELCTLEEPWRENPDGPGGMPGKSCVPDGQYVLYMHNGGRFQNVYTLVNPSLGVYKYDFDMPMGQKWGRASVLIHNGNTVLDIEGCILVGMTHGQLNGMPAVLESKIALGKLRAKLGANVHHLEIKPAEGQVGT